MKTYWTVNLSSKVPQAERGELWVKLKEVAGRILRRKSMRWELPLWETEGMAKKAMEQMIGKYPEMRGKIYVTEVGFW